MSLAESVRAEVHERDGDACRFCGMTADEHREERGRGLHTHHIVPRRDGGGDDPDNLLTVCGGCHATLEAATRRAIDGVVEARDADADFDDLLGVAEVWQKYWDKRAEYDAVLAEFADSNPTFRDEFEIFKEGTEGDPGISSWVFEEWTGSPSAVTSEWEFAVRFGYFHALADVLTGIDVHTHRSWADFLDEYVSGGGGERR